MTKNIELLKQVLSIPTKTYKEDMMISYLSKWLAANNIEFYLDDKRNIYATKNPKENYQKIFIFLV